MEIPSLPSFDNFWLSIIQWLLGISGVLVVLEAVGGMPQRLSKLLNRNRTSQTIETLKDLGIDVDVLRRRNIAASLPDVGSSEGAAERVRARLAPLTIKGPLDVGSNESAPSPQFIDLMGATTNPSYAVTFARELVTLLRDRTQEGATGDDVNFDFVATPKSGSPILGYEFSKIVKKPLMLHTRDTKFRSIKLNVRSIFDTLEVLPPRSKALIVDDSSTGGSKVHDLVIGLRDHGYIVSDCIVIFEPTTKDSIRRNAATRLQAVQVRLHSIIRAP